MSLSLSMYRGGIEDGMSLHIRIYKLFDTHCSIAQTTHAMLIFLFIYSSPRNLLILYSFLHQPRRHTVILLFWLTRSVYAFMQNKSKNGNALCHDDGRTTFRICFANVRHNLETFYQEQSKDVKQLKSNNYNTRMPSMLMNIRTPC